MSIKLNTAGGCAALIAFPIGAIVGIIMEIVNWRERRSEEKRLKEEESPEIEEEESPVTDEEMDHAAHMLIDDKVREKCVDFNDKDMVDSVISILTVLAKDVFPTADGDILVLNITREPDLVATICICGDSTISKNYICIIYNDDEGYYFKFNGRKWYFNYSLDKLENKNIQLEFKFVNKKEQPEFRLQSPIIKL